MLLSLISFFAYHFIPFFFRDPDPSIKEWLIDNQPINFNKCYPIYAFSKIFCTLLCKYLLEAYEVSDTLSKILEAKEIEPKGEKGHVCRIMGIIDGALKDGDLVRVFTYIITSIYHHESLFYFPNSHKNRRVQGLAAHLT